MISKYPGAAGITAVPRELRVGRTGTPGGTLSCGVQEGAASPGQRLEDPPGIPLPPPPAGRRPAPPPRGCQDARFPAARGAGRFQPRPIFGESLSRLRHPTPGGGGDGGLGAGLGYRDGVAFLKSVRGPAAAGDPEPGDEGAAGQSAATPAPERPSGGPAALRGRLARKAPRPDCVTFPVHPLLTRPPRGPASCSARPALQGPPSRGGVGTCV